MPALCIVANEQTPYRLHFHRRIAAELRDYRLLSVFTHEHASSPWSYQNDLGINPVLFGIGESSAEQAKTVRQLHEWRKGGRIIRCMEDQGVGAVVLYGYNDACRFRILVWCARRGIPCFIFGDSNIHGDRLRGWSGVAKKLILSKMLRLSSGVFCCGEFGRQYFERYGVKDSAIVEVPYEPDYALLEAVTLKEVQQIRAMFGLKEGRHRFLYVGRLEKVKRVDLLVRAFSRFAEDFPEWDLVIAGDGSLNLQLQQSVAPEVRNRLFWTGFIDDPRLLSALYAASDVFVLPSDYEPWGVVITEAAVHNAIVASSVVGAAREIVRPDENGYLFESGSLHSLENALRRVAASGDIAAAKSSSRRILSEWRRRTDPVANLRAALGRAAGGIGSKGAEDAESRSE